MLTNANNALSGFVRANNGLWFIEDRHCIIRHSPSRKEKVKLIAGGRWGHDPAFHGYVGKGMLDGAVCGGAFGPPPVRSIVDCLRVVAKPKESVLFIVNNYLADRLRFGMAVEQARSRYGYKKLEILLNDDDCAFGESETMKPLEKRGLAGCVVLIKILGAMAELRYSLDRLIDYGKQLLRNGSIATVGWTFDVNGDGLHNIEMGAGPGDQRGVRRINLSGTIDTITDSILDFAYNRIAKSIKPHPDRQIAVFVNNLGGTPEFVVDVFLNSASVKFAEGYTVERVYVGNFFSYANKSGLSITVVNLQCSDKLLEYLDYEVQVSSPLFRGASCYGLTPSQVLKFVDKQVSKALDVVQIYNVGFNTRDQQVIKGVLEQISHALLFQCDVLNTYGQESGAGDAGTIIARGANALLARLESHVDFRHPAKMLQDISIILQQSMGGITGAIYGLFLQGASNAFVIADRDRRFTNRDWLRALTYGIEAIERYSLYRVGDRTLLDVLRPVERDLTFYFLLKTNYDPLGFAETFADLCKKEAKETTTMIPSYKQLKFSATEDTHRTNFKHPEPGAYAVGVWAWALYTGYKKAFLD